MPTSTAVQGRGKGLPFQTGETITHIGRGRGIGNSSLPVGECLCIRSHRHVLCHVCGYLGWGRIRYSCPKHPQIIFLIDMTQCPKCKAYGFMMSEFLDTIVG